MKAANEYILSMAVRKNICPSKSVWEALPSIHVYFHCSDNIHPLSIVNSWACPSTSFPKGVISSFLRTHFLFINRISRQLGRSHTWINRHQLQDPPILPYVWLYRTSAGYLYYREYYRTVIIKIPKLFDLLPKNNSVLAMGSKNMDDNGAMDSLRSVGYTIMVCNYRSCTIPLKILQNYSNATLH